MGTELDGWMAVVKSVTKGTMVMTMSRISSSLPVQTSVRLTIIPAPPVSGAGWAGP